MQHTSILLGLHRCPQLSLALLSLQLSLALLSLLLSLALLSLLLSLALLSLQLSLGLLSLQLPQTANLAAAAPVAAPVLGSF
jgi:hypothetical protein